LQKKRKRFAWGKSHDHPPVKETVFKERIDPFRENEKLEGHQLNRRGENIENTGKNLPFRNIAGKQGIASFSKNAELKKAAAGGRGESWKRNSGGTKKG